MSSTPINPSSRKRSYEGPRGKVLTLFPEQQNQGQHDPSHHYQERQPDRQSDLKEEQRHCRQYQRHDRQRDQKQLPHQFRGGEQLELHPHRDSLSSLSSNSSEESNSRSQRRHQENQRRNGHRHRSTNEEHWQQVRECQQQPHQYSSVQEPRSSVVQVQDAIPTADDYANLLFCSSDEEDDEEEEKISENPSDYLEPENYQTYPSCQPCQPCQPVTPLAPLPTTTTTCEPITEEPSNKRRRVSFSPQPHLIHHLHDQPPAHALTTEEKSQQWLQPSDLELLQSSARKAIQQMRHIAKNAAKNYNDGRRQQRKEGGVASGVTPKKETKESLFRKLMLTLEKETNQSIRGLEHRVLKRKDSRRSLVMDVLECQSHLRGVIKFAEGYLLEDEVVSGTNPNDVDGIRDTMDGFDLGRPTSSNFGAVFGTVEEETQLDFLAQVSRKRSQSAVEVAVQNAKDDFQEVYCCEEEDGDAGKENANCDASYVSDTSSSNGDCVLNTVVECVHVKDGSNDALRSPLQKRQRKSTAAGNPLKSSFGVKMEDVEFIGTRL